MYGYVDFCSNPGEFQSKIHGKVGDRKFKKKNQVLKG